jgi:hypothetical protein
VADQIFSSWALLELMGHRQVAGMVEEVQIAGAKFLRVRVPSFRLDLEGRVIGLDLEKLRLEQNYSPGSVYCLTPTTEQQVARLLAREAAYLPALPPPGSPPVDEEDPIVSAEEVDDG